jgi:hypothetical protein
MPCVGFETTNPASERAKTVLAVDRSATVTGDSNITVLILSPCRNYCCLHLQIGPQGVTERYLFFSRYCSPDHCRKQINMADTVFMQRKRDLMQRGVDK